MPAACGRRAQGTAVRRRGFLAGLSAALAAASLPCGVRGAEVLPLRIGLTPVFLDDQVSFLQAWRHYLEARLERPVEFVQRGSYREIIDLTLADQVQFAWLCGYPFVRYRSRLRLLAVPVYRGQPLYQSYLIVPDKDTTTRTILDLKDRVFAYSDPDSNSGFLYPQYQLITAGNRPATFFRRSFFTFGHRNVVEAVAARVAHGGAVDGYVWDTLRLTHRDLVNRTRIADRSPPFGFPPMVASPATDSTAMKALQAALLGMANTAEGKALLVRLNLDRFEAGSPLIFEGIERMMRATAANR